MPKTAESSYSANELFFNAWVILMRVTCLLFLIIQSQMLGPNFTVYCVAVACLSNPLLSSISKFRRSEKYIKKLWAWLFLVSSTSCVAFVWGYTTDIKESHDIAQSFIMRAVETTVILLLVHAVITMSKYFSKWRSKRKNKNSIKN